MPLLPTDVGRRVVVRRRLARPVAGQRLTDVLGELVALTDQTLTVRRPGGELVHIATADIVAAKPVPPPSRRWPSDRRLEEIAAQGWRGLEEELLGEWRLRAAGGFTGRANSVLPIGESDRPLPAALAAVSAWYAERALPPLAQVPLPLAAGVDRALEAAGWRAYNPTRVLVAETARMLAACPEQPGLPLVRFAAAPDDEWLAGYHYRGRALPDGAIRVLTNASDPTFAATADGAGLLGVARGVTDEGWLGVTALTVSERARRRGVARHLMRGLAHWGAARGAEQIYLQVAEDNEPALALYAGLGFLVHHRYHYRTPRA